MLEAEEGEEVWQRLDGENGQCPRVHEVRPQGKELGEYSGWDLKLVISTTLQNTAEKVGHTSNVWERLHALSLYQSRLKRNVTLTPINKVEGNIIFMF